MHTSSYEHMKSMVESHLDKSIPLQIIDVGSYDVNGSYRPLFEQSGWTYRGIDLNPGPNVDIVLESPYRLPIPSHSLDVVVSGQAFEHIEFFWITWLEMVRVLKPGGMILLIAPSRGPEHRYPVDCWRFYTDGFKALAKYGGLENIEANTDWEPDHAEDSAAWGDSIGVFRKPQQGILTRLRKRVMYPLRRFATPGA